MAEWTPELLNVPYAIAAKHAAPGTNLFDELVSAGNEALVTAAARYDSSRGATLATFVYGAVKWKILDAINPDRRGSNKLRWARLASLDEPIGDKKQTLGDLVATDHCDPALPLEQAENSQIVDRLLRKLSPLARVAYVLRNCDGLSVAAIARRMHLTHKEILLALRRARTHLRMRQAACRRAAIATATGRCALLAGSQCAPPHTQKVREASRYQKEKKRADHALGKIPARKSLWYLAQDVKRILIGPSTVLTPLITHAGLPAPTSSTRGGDQRGHTPTFAERLAPLLAERGWRLVRGPEARRLAEIIRYVLVELPEKT